jgi:hypothetical protein
VLNAAEEYVQVPRYVAALPFLGTAILVIVTQVAGRCMGALMESSLTNVLQNAEDTPAPNPTTRTGDEDARISTGSTGSARSLLLVAILAVGRRQPSQHTLLADPDQKSVQSHREEDPAPQKEAEEEEKPADHSTLAELLPDEFEPEAIRQRYEWSMDIVLGATAIVAPIAGVAFLNPTGLSKNVGVALIVVVAVTVALIFVMLVTEPATYSHWCIPSGKAWNVSPVTGVSVVLNIIAALVVGFLAESVYVTDHLPS